MSGKVKTKARGRRQEVDRVERRMNAIAGGVAAIMAFGSLATALVFGYSVASGIQQDLATGELYVRDADGGVDVVSEQQAAGHRVATHIEVPEGHGVTVSAEGLSEGEVAVMLVATEGGPAVFDHSFVAGEADATVTVDDIEPRRYLVNARAMGSTGTITVRTHPLDDEDGQEASEEDETEDESEDETEDESEDDLADGE